MKLTKNATILTGAFATLIATAVIPMSFDGAGHDSFWAKQFSSAAYADDGNDDGGDNDSGDDNDSGSDDSDDDSGDDDGDSGSSSHDSDDDSNDDGDDDSADNDSNDDSDDDDNDDDSAGQSRGGLAGLFGFGKRNDDSAGNGDSAPRVQLQMSAADLDGLRNGSLKAVDNLGRVLEIEVETEHGATKIVAQPDGDDANRIPGAITSVKIVPAS